MCLVSAERSLAHIYSHNLHIQCVYVCTQPALIHLNLHGFCITCSDMIKFLENSLVKLKVENFRALTSALETCDYELSGSGGGIGRMDRERQRKSRLRR